MQKQQRAAVLAVGEHDYNRRPRAQQQLVEPVALVRPIPQRVRAVRPSDGLYAATESARIPFAHVHTAVKESYAWERKWLDRMNQVNPLLDDEEDDSILAVYIAERSGGARNPSPFEEERTMKRGLRSHDVFSKNEHCSSSVLVRTHSPVRMVRPIAVRPLAQTPPPQCLCIIPRDVLESGIAARSLSPITLSSSSMEEFLQFPPQSHRQSVRDENAPTLIEDDEEGTNVPPMLPAVPTTPISAVHQARDGILHALAITGGDTDSPQFQSCLSILCEHYRNTVNTTVNPYVQHEGTWLTLTKPTFFGCIGETDAGDPMYTLGRLTFDMFTPSDLICSLQGNFNTVHSVAQVPESLVPQVGSDPSVLRTYNIVTAFTIEPFLADYPDAPNKAVRRPIRGLLSTTGYMMADADANGDRHSVWITGGTMEPNDSVQDVADWKALFGATPARSLGAAAKLLAVKWLLGAVVDDTMDAATGCMKYSFTRPIGGVGKAYTDTLYADGSLRIVRGHRGTVFVFSKQLDHNN